MQKQVNIIVLLLLGLTAAVPTLMRQTKMVGGNVAVISQYPSTVALLTTLGGNNYVQSCVGTILTTKSIVTAGHCLEGDPAVKWRARAGSSWANSGGSVYILISILIHPDFNVRTMDSDIAIIWTAVPITFSDVVKPAAIVSSNYNLPDNQVVWAIGYGSSESDAPDHLRRLQIWTVQQTTCASRYSLLGSNVTTNMLCAGLLNTNSGGQCVGDSGGPLFHNGNLVGVYSWGFSCANPQYPGISTRVSRFTTWLKANA